MSVFFKMWAVALLFGGEFFTIYAEMIAARLPSFATTPVLMLTKIIALFFVGSASLMTGYYCCYKAYQNIWVVTSISIVSILLVEPVLAWLLFNDFPTRGATIGLIFGALGLLATITL
jgi:hypothetical protein